VLAGQERSARELRVQEVGQGDVDRVHARVCHALVVVGVDAFDPVTTTQLVQHGTSRGAPENRRERNAREFVGDGQKVLDDHV